jgi:hypothetical protein
MFNRPTRWLELVGLITIGAIVVVMAVCAILVLILIFAQH